MDEPTFEKELNALVKELGATPSTQPKKLIELAKEAKGCHKELEKSMNGLQESLDYLRVCIKYMMFDVEATRRENKYLRKMIEGNEG